MDTPADNPPDECVTLSDALSKWTTDSSVVSTLLDRIRDRYQELNLEAHNDHLEETQAAATDLHAAAFELCEIAEAIFRKTSGLKRTQVPSYYLDVSITPSARRKENEQATASS
jgi:hypothetical protein